jgi:hypothetical protein
MFVIGNHEKTAWLVRRRASSRPGAPRPDEAPPGAFRRQSICWNRTVPLPVSITGLLLCT